MNINWYYIFPSLDGLDATKQSFTGSINTKPRTFHSHGAMDYETVLLIADPKTEYNDNEFHETGRKWPQVKTTFELKRRAFQHILQTFFPACCLGPDHLLSFFCSIKVHARMTTRRKFHPFTVCTFNN